jgi:hypothetical protein
MHERLLFLASVRQKPPPRVGPKTASLSTNELCGWPQCLRARTSSLAASGHRYIPATKEPPFWRSARRKREHSKLRILTGVRRTPPKKRKKSSDGRAQETHACAHGVVGHPCRPSSCDFPHIVSVSAFGGPYSLSSPLRFETSESFAGRDKRTRRRGAHTFSSCHIQAAPGGGRRHKEAKPIDATGVCALFSRRSHGGSCRRTG